MILILLLTLPCAAAQDEDVDELIEQLQSESLVEREEAIDQLVKLGDKALPGLRSLKTDDTDLQARVRDIIKQIETGQKLRSLRGAVYKLTGEWKDVTLKGLLDEWNQSCDKMFACNKKLETEKVSLKIKNVAPWTAATLLSRSHGNIRTDFAPTGVVFSPGKPATSPMRISGPFVLRVEQITRSTYGEFGGASSETSVVRLNIGYQPNVKPTHVTLNLESVEDDQGKSLIMPGQALQPHNAPSSSQKSIQLLLTLNKAHEKATKIKSLKTSFRIQYVLSYKELAFKDPLGKSAMTIVDEKDRYTLNHCRRQGKYIDVEIRSTKKRARGLDGQSLFVLIDKKGKSYTGSVHSTTWHGTGDITYGMYYPLSDDVKIDRLSYRLPRETHMEELHFEFKQLPLP